ncbi:MAG: dihydroorotase [Candidatus Merdivicinus sp.]
MPSYLLKNLRIISPADALDLIGNIRIADGKFAGIGKDLPEQPGDTVLDFTGKTAFPGLIDMHVHLRDPGFTYKEDVLTGCEAAAAGGVTAVACMPNTKPVTDSPEVLQYILEKAKTAKASVYPVAAITQGMQGGTLTDMAALKAAGAVAVSDDGKPVPNGRLMMEGMKKAEQNGLLTISHCEDLEIIHGGIMHKGSVSEELGVPGMDRASEDAITAREIALANSADTRIHIAHVSTAGAADFIRSAKKRGVKVTCETAPHYFLLTHELLRTQDADYRMNPPLREESDVEAMRKAVADGTIDCIVTDHAPHAAEEKADFRKAPNGVVGLETSFAASYTGLVKSGLIPLSRLIELMSVNPARILGIPGGQIQVGADADLAIADLNAVWTVDPEKLHSKSKNTVFKGMEFTGKIVCTFHNGQIVYESKH